MAFAREMKVKYPEEGILIPDAQHLSLTHRPIVTLRRRPGTEDVPETEILEEIYMTMQGETWSVGNDHRNAQDLIRLTGVGHTSMSCGDVIVTDDGRAFIVAALGFDFLGWTHSHHA